jgi:hypothetical protein
MTFTDAATSPVWQRRAWSVITAVSLLRLLFQFTLMDFQLSGDEAYYWDWGRQLDWGYYSKPPLIGWLMGAIRVVFDGSWHGVRVTSILLGSITLVMMFLLGRKLFDVRIGFIAMLLMLCTPLNVGLTMAMTIDVPLLLCWTAALWLLARAIEQPQSTTRWLTLGIMIGVGSLAKQMMLVFPVLLLLWLACTPSHRHMLRSARLWAALGLGLLFLLPPLWWNSQHGWPTVKHTLEHNLAAHDEGGLLQRLLGFVQLTVLQALMFGGMTFVLMVIALRQGHVQRADLPLPARLLWWFSAPLLLSFGALACYKEVNPNWPTVGYVAALPLVAFLAHRWVKTALIVGASCGLLVYVAVPVLGTDALRGSKLDVFRDLRGWEETGQHIGALLAACPQPEKTFVYVTDHRHYVSQLAFWMPQHPRVYRWNRTGEIESQYEVWPSADDKRGWDALIVHPNNDKNGYSPRELSGLISRRFYRVDKLADVDIPVGNGTHRAFQVYYGDHLIRLPPPMKKSQE